MKTKINICFFILLSYVPMFNAQQKLIHSDRTNLDYFGAFLGVFDNYIIISADGQDKDENGENSISDAGAAYLFERNSNGEWIQKQKITASDRKEYVLYGFPGIDINEEYLLIGARYADNIDTNGNLVGDAGAAYLYKKNSSGYFLESQKLTATDIAEYSLFGKQVKIFQDFCIVSAPSAWCESVGTTPYSDAGAVYLFEPDSNGLWEEKQKLMSSDRATGDNFGQAIAVSTNHIVIGAYLEDEDETGNNTINNAGSAYIFEKDTDGDWVETQKIVAPDRYEEDAFGTRIDIYANTLVISSLNNSTDENFTNVIADAGAVYVYEKENGGVWNFKQKLVPSDRETIRNFGASVKVTDKYIIASNYYEQNGSTVSSYGSVYIFEKNSDGKWIETKKLIAPDGNNGDMFGYCVSVSDEHIAIGSPFHDKDLNGENHKSNAGAAYVYNIGELLSVQDNQFSTPLELTVFPNPNNGSFTLELGKRINGSVTITDVLGKIRHTETFISDKLNINLDLPKGIYFANIKAEEGNSLVKFVVG